MKMTMISETNFDDRKIKGSFVFILQVPAMTLPSWNQNATIDDASDLLSPTKNLLPALANPLNPRISPYFAGNRNMVVAPHPSALPLPSVSLTARKDGSERISPTSSASECFNEHETADRVDTTPTKRCK